MIEVPTKCSECRFCGDYTHGSYSRNPHYCCEMIWTLVKDDYRVNADTLDVNCPLKDTRLLQVISDLADKLDIGDVCIKEN